MALLRRVDRALAKAEEILVFALLLALLLLAVWQVLWRNVVQPMTHKAPLLWADELLKHATFVLGLLGGVLATHFDKHISLDVLSRAFAGRKRLEAGVRALARLFALGICVVLARAGLAQVRMMEDAFESVLQPWQWQIAIPSAFGLIALHLAVRLVADLAAAAGKGEPAP